MQKMKIAVPPTDAENGQSTIIDPQLMQILVCPRTKGPLIWDRSASELISVQAALAFPVKEGVPLLQLQTARSLSDEELILWKRK